MSDSGKTPRDLPVRSEQPGGFYYGWMMLAVAVVALVATLPGRTWGLGLITEPLLKEFQLDREAYANLNFWGTIIGAAFCLPIGRMMDRYGARLLLTIVTLCLGGTVVVMSQIPDSRPLLILITLTRGFGQSALSILAISLVGKWFYRRISLAMTIYSVAIILGFMVAEQSLGYAVKTYGWRTAWWGTGMVLLCGAAPLFAIFTRSTPESVGQPVDGFANPKEETDHDQVTESPSLTLSAALITPAFWTLAFSMCLNSLTQAGISLFGVSFVTTQGFEQPMDIYVQIMLIATFAALPGNLFTGWKAEAWSIRRMIAIGMALLAVSLGTLPVLQSLSGIYAFAAIWGLACGILAVALNAVWSRVFGREHLGKIQGAVGVLHVLTSALGPKIMARCLSLTGSYQPFFYFSTVLAVVAVVAVWFVPFPSMVTKEETAPVPQHA